MTISGAQELRCSAGLGVPGGLTGSRGLPSPSLASCTAVARARRARGESLDASRLRVLVAGEAKRGKSTVVNALLGRDVLPTGVIPLTAVPTTVVQAPDEEGIEIAFTSGRTSRLSLSALPDFCTERGNPGNCRHVADITVGLDATILARGVEIVDMPGAGSVHAHNTAADKRSPDLQVPHGLR
jgi:ribosome biogenesis GTPase A